MWFGQCLVLPQSHFDKWQGQGLKAQVKTCQNANESTIFL